MDEEGEQQPYLIPIGERAEEIARSFKERQESTQEALAQFEALVKEISEAERSRADKGLPADAFTVYWLLKRDGVAEARADGVARDMAAMFTDFPYWQRRPEQEQAIRHRLYVELKELGGRCVQVVGQLIDVLKQTGA